MICQAGRPIVIGAGPAGLTVAYRAAQLGYNPLVFERENRVGGLARTEQYNGNRFDLGGHRFFTKSTVVNRLWQEMLGEDFLLRPRLSRIFYRGMYFNYPPSLREAFCNLGPRESVCIGLSYLRRQFAFQREENTFEDWVVNRFGRRLFEIFFRAYTEKVWGLPCSELRAEWAAQRIKDLSLRTVLLRKLTRSHTVKSLIECFHYPRLGPGMMWERFADSVKQRGGTIVLGSQALQIHHVDQRITAISISQNGKIEKVPVEQVISTMPINELILSLTPAPPEQVQAAAKALKHRDFITVCLVLRGSQLFPDNWIYVHDPTVKVARIQNYKNWSSDMVAKEEISTLGMEYFCNAGDTLWTETDSELIAQADRDLRKLELAPTSAIIDGTVIRVKNAYPVYDSTYSGDLQTIKTYLTAFTNLQTVGRNGLHRYNNQDHSMMTGLLAAENLNSSRRLDVWAVNSEAEYHEEADDGSL